MTESETVILRRDLVSAMKRMDRLERENTDLKKEIAQLRQKNTLYENCNMPTSTTSLYHNERNRFRQRRNEDTALSGAYGNSVNP